ncbi:hypothetical protein [Paraglaciecola marina]|uniref:hypothetical protein n=1 Tax=Paraglaciecola marina TaxID=2500157 RepID=UPI00105DB686|nr:hypothetical protein [Paraglaciecola marina]
MLNTDTKLIRPSNRRPADLTASLLIPKEGGKPDWQHYFALWLVKEGFYKGKDKDGNTIIAMTKAAKDAISGQKNNGKKRPDLFIHIEGEDEQGEKIWDEILAAWKSRNGNYLTENEDGIKIVIQPREAKETLLKKFARKRMAAIDLTPATPIEEEEGISEAVSPDLTQDT